MIKEKVINKVFDKLLSLKVKEQSERVILSVAIISYLIHLTLILLANYDIIQIESITIHNNWLTYNVDFMYLLLLIHESLIHLFV